MYGVSKAWILLIIAVVAILIAGWNFLVIQPLNQNNGVWNNGLIGWAIFLGIMSIIFWLVCGFIGADIQNGGNPPGYNDWDMSTVNYIFGPLTLILDILV